MSEARYWFVRHAQSTANAEGWLAGHRDAPLTARGIAEATALASELTEIAPDRVWSSDLRRTVHTATLSWGQRRPEVQQTRHLRERDLGEWEGCAGIDLARSGGMEVLTSFDGLPPGGESHRTLGIRALTWLSAHDDGRSMLLFSHGGLIRTVLGLLDGMPRDQIGRFKIGNAALHVRDVPRGRFAELLAEMGGRTSGE